jgi:hypothetical protein
MKLTAITVALFCGLYALFFAVAVATHQPAPEVVPEPQPSNWRTMT